MATADENKGKTTRGGLTTTPTKQVDSSGETQIRSDVKDGLSTVSPDRIDPNTALFRDGAHIPSAVEDPREGEFSVVEPNGSEVPEAEKSVLFRPFPQEQVVLEEPKASYDERQKGK